ncbi:TPA: hypothetical protein VBX77_003317 [Yersinia enterocolitica]|nr:hypothetical protein [Yersinia enterocolitica]
MEITYTKEKLLIMLEEIQEELNVLDATLVKSKNQNMQFIKDHIDSLNEIENGMAILQKKDSVSQLGVSTDVATYPIQRSLYLNLAK